MQTKLIKKGIYCKDLRKLTKSIRIIYSYSLLKCEKNRQKWGQKPREAGSEEQGQSGSTV